MDRVAFTLFGVDIMWYGILMAIGAESTKLYKYEDFMA